MDFNFSEEQKSLQQLAREILGKEVTPERIKAIESGTEWFDRPLWSTLAQAGLLGLAVPEDHGGMGYGILEICLLLHEIGRAVAPVPAMPSLVLGALPIAEFGTDEQKKAWLPSVASGETILTAALLDAESSDLTMPAARARQEHGGWQLNGCKLHVPAVHLASRILVPATTTDGAGIFLVDPQAKGVTLTRHKTSTGEPLFTVNLYDVALQAGDLLGDDSTCGGDTVSWIYDRALAALCATHVGVAAKALEITSAYVSQRIQFGVPIGTFQAVQHRAADGYVDVEAMRWVTWRTAWKLAQGLPATRETMVAKFWCAEGGSRVVNSAQHLHGGIGVDLDYPVHRYFLWSKALEISLGSASPQLARLGRDMARTGPQEFS
jgi:alkylation response protein AidB-like acyl-CoA dehydrogenase